MSDTKYPKFERRENEGVTMLTQDRDEFGELQITRTHFSEKTAERLKRELDAAIAAKCET